MDDSSSPFAQYVALARNGKSTVWRLLLGIMVLVPVTLAAGLVVGIIGIVLTVGRGLLGHDAEAITATFLDSIPGTLTLLAGFAAVWLAVWVILRLCHGRSLGSALGWQERICWGDFMKGMAAILLPMVIVAALSWPFDQPERSPVALQTWLFWLAPLLVCLLIQTSAEELLFRGWLMQTLAARFKSPLVWAVLPSLVFVALHWQPGLPAPALTLLLGAILLLTVLLVATVWRTGNLGAAIGLHFGNNAIAFLLFSSEGLSDQLALFNITPFDEIMQWPDLWPFAIQAVITYALPALLLLHRRSPLSLRPAAPDVAPARPDAFPDGRSAGA